MYAWEKAFKQMIQIIQEKELYHILRSHTWTCVTRSIAFFVQLWGSLIFFIIIYYSGQGELTVATMLSTIQLSFFIRFFGIVLMAVGLDAVTNIKITFDRMIPLLSMKKRQAQVLIESEAHRAISFQKYSSFWSKGHMERGESSVKNITMHIDQGSLIGVVGKIGSGKSTFLSCLMEELPLTTGTLSYFGKGLEGIIKYSIYSTITIIFIFIYITSLFS